jgi:hypothetical protein
MSLRLITKTGVAAANREAIARIFRDKIKTAPA